MEYGILSGKKIVEEIEKGSISITPFVRKNVNPASVDLTLGKKISVYKSVTQGSMEKMPNDGISGHTLCPNIYGHIDAKTPNEVHEYELEEGEAIYLKPGIGYLAHTEERVWTDSFVPILDGKSSIGRLFTIVHITAGLGDPGFNGQYTLEIAVIHPVILYIGMKICQMRFQTICGEHTSYQETGNYKGVLADGPVPSQSYKMFRK